MAGEHEVGAAHVRQPILPKWLTEKRDKGDEKSADQHREPEPLEGLPADGPNI
jgi:hypothetical protein